MSFRPSAAAVKLQVELALAHKIPSALTVPERQAAAVLEVGIAALDAAIGGGIPRGALTEICGASSSGRTSVLLSLLAQATRRGEAVALVDASDAFDPRSTAQAGVEWKRLLWVRCRPRIAELQNCGIAGLSHIPQFGNSAIPQFVTTRRQRMLPIEQALKATDLLLQSGGFGLVAIDLGDIAAEDARRVPLTTWFRFRRAVEKLPTALVVVEQEPYAKTCASLVMELKAARREFALSATSHQPPEKQSRFKFHVSRQNQNLSWQKTPWGHCASAAMPTHAHLLHGMSVAVQISRGQIVGKKPARSAIFASSCNLAIG